jgi:hypothetical protein
MAQAPEFNPTVNPISFRPNPVVSGAKDKGSTLSMLAGLGKMTAEGIDAWNTQSAMEEIQTNLGALNEEYLTRSPSMIKKLEEDQTAEELYKQNITSMTGFETAERAEQEYSAVEKSLSDRLALINKGKAQGRLSTDDFALRAKAIVKDVVAKNPHLTAEALRQLSQSLSISGIQERMEIDTKMLKAEQSAYDTQYKAITQELKERDIPSDLVTTNGILNFNAAEFLINEDRKQEYLLKEAKRINESNELVDKNQLNEFIKAGGHVAIENKTIKNARSAVVQILNSSGDYNSKVNSISIALDDQIAAVKQEFARFSNDPTIKASIESTISRLNDLKQTIVKSESQANTLEFMDNQNKINTIIEENQLRGAVGNLERLNLLSKFANTPLIGSLLADGNKELVTKILNTIIDMNKGVRLTEENLAITPDKKQSDASLGFDLAATSLQEGKADASRMLNTNTSDRVKVINNTPDLNQKFVFTEDYLKQLADPKYVTAVNSLDTETKTESAKVIADFSRALGGKLKGLADQEGVSFSFTPDGMLSATGVSRQDTLDVVNRINTALGAYANLAGMSPKAASKEFFTSFYGNVFNAKDIPNVDEQYKAQAKALIPAIKQLESSNRMYEVKKDIFGNEAKVFLEGATITRKDGSTEKALGAYQLLPSTMRRPGLGVTPVDFTKTGKAMEVEMERFATDYTAALLKRFNGDERKALAAYNAGLGNVEEAVTKASKEGKPADWVKYMPPETRNHLAKFSNIAPAKVDEKVILIKSLREEQNKILQANPSIYNDMFNKGSSVELAKDIAEELGQNRGITIQWNEVHKIMEENNLMPEEVNPRVRTGKIRK